LSVGPTRRSSHAWFQKWELYYPFHSYGQTKINKKKVKEKEYIHVYYLYMYTSLFLKKNPRCIYSHGYPGDVPSNIKPLLGPGFTDGA
jgi:hypothetical protein